jgi:hypothetical protein
VINGLQHVFEKWVERCKSASLAKGGTSRNRPSPHLHKVSTRSNKASPRTLQTALVHVSIIAADFFQCFLPTKAYEQNEHRKSPKANFTLSANRKNFNLTSSEEMGGKYQIVTGHMAKHLSGGRGRRRPILNEIQGCHVL